MIRKRESDGLRLARFASGEIVVIRTHMKEQKNLRTGLLVAALVAGLSAQADPVLTVSDGVTSSGPITLTGGSGFFSTASFDSAWNVVVVAGESKPIVGSATSPNLEMNIQATSTGAGKTLTLTLSDNGFGPTLGNFNAQLVGQPLSGSGDVVNFNTFFDTNNTLSALTTALTTSGTIIPVGGQYLNNQSGSLNQAGPYSLTEVVTIAGNTAATYSLLANVQGSNQPCTCTVSFTCPSNVMVCADDTIPDGNTEASQILATDTCVGAVPVTFMGATTNNATCPNPTIITYNFGATSSCGSKLFTCQQTITVNCKPVCTITAVSNTIAGTTGLTASVPNAGTGATYAWILNNGTITAGQGTRTITYTAGNDTNNPVSICVTVTGANGCQSTCCATVKVGPKPPQTNIGSGDTATIGFWHNKNGQGLINGASNSPALSDWLAGNFPCLFGSISNSPNSTVAALFLTDFGVSGQKTQAQVMAGALAVYFTTSSLGGGAGPGKFGFNNTPGGTGGHLFNVGNNGTAIGLSNNTSYTVMQLLQAANANCPFTANSTVGNALNNIFDSINQTGDIN